MPKNKMTSANNQINLRSKRRANMENHNVADSDLYQSEVTTIQHLNYDCLKVVFTFLSSDEIIVEVAAVSKKLRSAAHVYVSALPLKLTISHGCVCPLSESMSYTIRPKKICKKRYFEFKGIDLKNLKSVRALAKNQLLMKAIQHLTIWDAFCWVSTKPSDDELKRLLSSLTSVRHLTFKMQFDMHFGELQSQASAAGGSDAESQITGAFRQSPVSKFEEFCRPFFAQLESFWLLNGILSPAYTCCTSSTNVCSQAEAGFVACIKQMKSLKKLELPMATFCELKRSMAALTTAATSNDSDSALGSACVSACSELDVGGVSSGSALGSTCVKAASASDSADFGSSVSVLRVFRTACTEGPCDQAAKSVSVAFPNVVVVELSCITTHDDRNDFFDGSWHQCIINFCEFAKLRNLTMLELWFVSSRIEKLVDAKFEKLPQIRNLSLTVVERHADSGRIAIALLMVCPNVLSLYLRSSTSLLFLEFAKALQLPDVCTTLKSLWLSLPTDDPSQLASELTQRVLTEVVSSLKPSTKCLKLGLTADTKFLAPVSSTLKMLASVSALECLMLRFELHSRLSIMEFTKLAAQAMQQSTSFKRFVIKSFYGFDKSALETTLPKCWTLHRCIVRNNHVINDGSLAVYEFSMCSADGSKWIEQINGCL